jgi:succinoglycan biosynthesis transport protein ExoP
MSEHFLRDLVDAVRRRWIPAAVVAASVIAVAVPIALGLPDLYQSSASLVVDQAPDPLGQRDSQMLELSGRLQTIRQEALSRQRVIDLTKELDLYHADREADQIDAVLAKMQRDVKVEPISASRGDGRMTTVSFRISYTGNDPRKVATVANRLAQFYVSRNDDITSRYATRAVDSLRKELDAAQKRLETQEQKVIEFTKSNAATLPSSLTALTAKISQLRQQLQANTALISGLMDRREAAQNSIAALSAPSGVASVSDPSVRLAAAERELKELLAKYYEDNLEVRKKRSEITGLREQVAANTKAGVSGAGETTQIGTFKSQIEGWTARIESLLKENRDVQADLDKLDGLVGQAPVRNAEFERINREATQARQAYDALYATHQKALVGERAQQGPGGPEFQVLDAAVPADQPSAPNRQVLLGLGVLAAFGLGFAVVILLERLDRAFKSVDELRAFTHVPVLATIPRIVLRRSKLKRAVGIAVGGAAVSAGLWFVSVGVFKVAQQAEPLTRMLLR